MAHVVLNAANSNVIFFISRVVHDIVRYLFNLESPLACSIKHWGIIAMSGSREAEKHDCNRYLFKYSYHFLCPNVVNQALAR